MNKYIYILTIKNNNITSIYQSNNFNNIVKVAYNKAVSQACLKAYNTHNNIEATMFRCDNNKQLNSYLKMYKNILNK